LPAARLLLFLPDVLGFAVVAAFLVEIFDIVVLLSQQPDYSGACTTQSPRNLAGEIDIIPAAEDARGYQGSRSRNHECSVLHTSPVQCATRLRIWGSEVRILSGAPILSRKCDSQFEAPGTPGVRRGRTYFDLRLPGTTATNTNAIRFMVPSFS